MRLSLKVFMLRRLRNKFLQLLLISHDYRHHCKPFFSTEQCPYICHIETFLPGLKSFFLLLMHQTWTDRQLDSYYRTLSSLPNDQILNLSKLKAFAEDEINVTRKLKFALGSVENISGKRRKC